MSMILEVNGTPYTNFLTGRVEIRLDVLSNTFNFTAARSAEQPLPFKIGDPCRVLINDIIVFTGSIEIMTVTYNSNSHEIELAGRDKTGDILDSSLDAISDIGEGVSLKSIIEQIISHIGADIKVIEGTKVKNFNAAEDIASPEAGDNAFEFIENLARERQVLLTSDGEGNLVITQSSGETLSGVVLQNAIGASDNNILSGSVSYDNTGRYNLYKMSSQLNPVALINAGNTDLDSLVSQSGRTLDSEIRLGRQLILTSESSFGETDNFNRSLWEANIRKARGRMYTVKVRGFNTEAGGLWEINKLVSVIDDFAGISGQMLLNTIIFNLDEQGGETSELTLLESNSYTLALEEPVSNTIGDGFI